MSVTSRNTGDDLYLEVEAGEPVDAERSPVRVGWLAENLLLDGHDRSELVFGVGVEAGDIDNIIQRAAGGTQRGLQIVKGQPHLPFEIGFGCSVRTAADLSGYKQQIAGSDRGGIAMLFIMRAGWWERLLRVGSF